MVAALDQLWAVKDERGSVAPPSPKQFRFLRSFLCLNFGLLGIGWVLMEAELNHEDQLTPGQDGKEGLGKLSVWKCIPDLSGCCVLAAYGSGPRDFPKPGNLPSPGQQLQQLTVPVQSPIQAPTQPSISSTQQEPHRPPLTVGLLC
jgi:hypothetical protein